MSVVPPPCKTPAQSPPKRPKGSISLYIDSRVWSGLVWSGPENSPTDATTKDSRARFVRISEKPTSGVPLVVQIELKPRRRGGEPRSCSFESYKQDVEARARANVMWSMVEIPKQKNVVGYPKWVKSGGQVRSVRKSCSKRATETTPCSVWSILDSQRPRVMIKSRLA